MDFFLSFLLSLYFIKNMILLILKTVRIHHKIPKTPVKNTNMKVEPIYVKKKKNTWVY
jgi:hypothetical protein